MIFRQVHDIEAEAPRDGDAAITVSIGVEQQQLRAGHEGGPDERFGAGIRVITIHDDEPGSNAAQRSACALVCLREVWPMSGELDGGAKKSGGERIGREDQYIVAAQRNVPARGCGWCRDRGRASEQEEDHSLTRVANHPYLTTGVHQ